MRLRCVFARTADEQPAFADVVGRTSAEAARLAAAEIRRQLAGEVTLVGAGPGDPGLITVKGLEALKAADVIVYDRLVDDALLQAAKPGCELIYVGKASGNHTLPQDEINALLAKKALMNARVVRLKGGDPFVFGRGGEEAEYLLSRGIACTVVPGVTSAVAVPASVGIPVTHRGVAQGFEVVTAHAKDDEPVDIDFSRLLDPKRTYVFLMGLRRLGEIAAAFIAAGKPSATPAAVVSAGTTSNARCVTGTLADIAAKAAALASPAVLVVGETVRLRNRLGFPLSGRRLLVPEIEGGRGRLAALLMALGAEVDVLPVGRIVAVPGALTAKSLQDVTWLAFTSRNGLLPFDAALVGEVRRRGLRVAAIGKATAAACEARGLKADFVAENSTGDGFLTELRSCLTPSDVVLHPTVAGSPDSLARIAEDCGYSAVEVYRNEAVAIDRPVNLGDYDAALFTCASSARRVYAASTGVTRALAIGPSTGAALEGLGAEVTAQASSPDPAALVRLAVGLFSDLS